MNGYIILYFYPAMDSSDTAGLHFAKQNPLEVQHPHPLSQYKRLKQKHFSLDLKGKPVALDLVYIKI